jgi:tetratricopeptide (TPR) repeat protein
MSWEKLGHYEDAMNNYNQAAQLQPNDPLVWYNKARCYTLQKNIAAAIENLQKAIDLSPETYLPIAANNSDFDTIRSDERFQALIQEQKQKH